MLCVSGINWDKNEDEKKYKLNSQICEFLWYEKLSRRAWKFFKNSSAYPKSSFMFTCLPLTLNWAEKSIRDVCDSSWLTHEWKTHKSLATTTAENKKSFLLHDGSERMEKILMMMKWICSNMLQCVLKCEEKTFTNWRDCKRCKGWLFLEFFHKNSLEIHKI